MKYIYSLLCNDGGYCGDKIMVGNGKANFLTTLDYTNGVTSINTHDPATNGKCGDLTNMKGLNSHHSGSFLKRVKKFLIMDA